jgi:uncharacterized protein (TIGR02266 family)
MGRQPRTPKRRVERRSFQRRTCEVHIDLHTDSQFFNGFSTDLSDGGVFVATYTPAPIGTELALEFDLPAGHKVRTVGRVIWVRDEATGAAPGMGVAFQSLSSDDRDAILAFTEQRPALFYDPESVASVRSG